jgi:hypothetical protein
MPEPKFLSYFNSTDGWKKPVTRGYGNYSQTFTADATTDAITYATEIFPGAKVRFTTTGTLPAPLAINTDYYANCKNWIG